MPQAGPAQAGLTRARQICAAALSSVGTGHQARAGASGLRCSSTVLRSPAGRWLPCLSYVPAHLPACLPAWLPACRISGPQPHDLHHHPPRRLPHALRGHAQAQHPGGPVGGESCGHRRGQGGCDLHTRPTQQRSALAHELRECVARVRNNELVSSPCFAAGTCSSRRWTRKPAGCPPSWCGSLPG